MWLIPCVAVETVPIEPDNIKKGIFRNYPPLNMYKSVSMLRADTSWFWASVSNAYCNYDYKISVQQPYKTTFFENAHM